MSSSFHCIRSIKLLEYITNNPKHDIYISEVTNSIPNIHKALYIVRFMIKKANFISSESIIGYAILEDCINLFDGTKYLGITSFKLAETKDKHPHHYEQNYTRKILIQDVL